MQMIDAISKYDSSVQDAKQGLYLDGYQQGKFDGAAEAAAGNAVPAPEGGAVSQPVLGEGQIIVAKADYDKAIADAKQAGIDEAVANDPTKFSDADMAKQKADMEADFAVTQQNLLDQIAVLKKLNTKSERDKMEQAIAEELQALKEQQSAKMEDLVKRISGLTEADQAAPVDPAPSEPAQPVADPAPVADAPAQPAPVDSQPSVPAPDVPAEPSAPVDAAPSAPAVDPVPAAPVDAAPATPEEPKAPEAP